MTIADRIRNRRLELGLSVDDLPDCSDSDESGVLIVTHPNTKVTIYHLSM